MKGLIHPLLLASAYLVLFTSVGRAYLEGETFDLGARNLGHSVPDNYGTRDYQADYHHTRRQLPQPDLSSLSTRALTDELSSRLEKRGEADTVVLPAKAKLIAEYKQLHRIQKKSKPQKKRYRQLKGLIWQQSDKYWALKGAEESAGASDSDTASGSGHGSNSDSESSSSASSPGP
ncbi:hypothetical protein CVT24_005544 [Panaeolus cyanescens]|uniref:Secreted protein n=1 Tax=Panaeolus cyanescens TaxID=181874 RepID=A0A409VQK7_9AGAR|nr:hypothetical protein CVT24_005544 [Panaeolus cyanescens]